MYSRFIKHLDAHRARYSVTFFVLVGALCWFEVISLGVAYGGTAVIGAGAFLIERKRRASR
jgi:hypothetical protein